MDPITLAIIESLAKLGDSVIKDAYDALKKAIASKCGVESKVSDAIKELEKNPNSDAPKTLLSEAVVKSEVIKDPEVVRTLENLQALLPTQRNNCGQVNIQVTGGTVQGVVGAGQSQIGSLNFTDNSSRAK